jgi:membrane fusion protein (multidrug efflux system)
MRHVSPGALIEPGGPIVSLDDISVIKLDFQVPEKNLSNLRVGQEITAQSEAYPTRVFFGTVTSIDTRVDPVTRAIAARARIDNTDLALKPGMFLLVELGVSERHNAVLIPEEAVVSDGTARFVYVVVDGQAKRRSVALGQRLPGEVEVLDGVKAGEAVIVGGVQKVRDGTPVAARERTAPTS